MASRLTNPERHGPAGARSNTAPVAQVSNGAAFTLVELMVATGLSLFLLTAALSFYLFSTRSFAAIANYNTLNNQDRNASDILTRDIRCAAGVSSINSNRLVLKYFDGTNLSFITYAYDPGAGTLTRSNLSSSQILLSGINPNSFLISAYQRPATNAYYNVFSSATATNAKIVSFQWSCSRRVVGTQSSSETLQTANVVLRNQ